MPMWRSRPATRRVTVPALLILSWRTRSWVSVVAVGAGGGFGAGCVGGRRGGPVRRERCGRRWLYSSRKVSRRVCSSAMVVGWAGWARSHFLRVCWKRSTLPQVVGWLGREFFWAMSRRRSSASKAVAAALAAVAGEPDGVDHAVVGERGCGVSVQVSGLPEGGQHDRGGDPGSVRTVQGVAGVVVEPGDDLGVRAGGAVGVGEPVVGEVGLPGLVGLLGLEPDVGATSVAWTGRGSPCPARTRIRLIVARGHRDLVVMLEVPADGVRAGVQAGVGQLLA